MNRRLFLSYSCTFAVGAGAGAVVLSGCSKKDEPEPDPGPGNGAKLSADLSTELTSIGSSKSQNNIVVVRVAEGATAQSFVALSSVCTHQACTIGYQPGDNQFVCPCHGSRFSISGAVVNGPAAAALAKYTVNIDGTTLTVA